MADNSVDDDLPFESIPLPPWGGPRIEITLKVTQADALKGFKTSCCTEI